LHSLRKPYESGGRVYRYVALVCPRCPASFTLADLGLTVHADLFAASDHHVAAPRSAGDTVAAVPSGPDTVGGITAARWGVRPELAVARYSQPGWQYLRETEFPCPHCRTSLHALYRVYYQLTQARVQAAVVCPACPATFTTRQLKLSRRLVLGELRAELLASQPTTAPPAPPAGSPTTTRSDAPSRVAARDPRFAPPHPAHPVDSVELGCTARPGVQIHAARASTIPALLPPPSPPRRNGMGPTRAVTVAPPTEHRLLHWCKTTDPAWELPDLPTGTDVRVLVSAEAAFDPLRTRLSTCGVPHRSVPYWLEDETITTVNPRGQLQPLTVTASLTRAGGLSAEHGATVADQPAYDARDAFATIWDVHEDADPEQQPPPVPAAELIPQQWLSYLPFPHFNPAQAQAAPIVLHASGHVVITAPTGAGKTVLGMLAALRTILGEGRKAAWLVPQRSLTEELDRELASWSAQGLSVERLSGEYSTDIQKVRAADLWIATTEKFEAICRASSLQTALEEVGCLVVDEIHMLGAAERGPLLEALLARVRGVDSPVRIVGLSATVANAAEIAEWLDGTLVTTTWRPSRLTWQLPMIPAVADRRIDSELRTRVTVDLTQRVTEEGGSVLVFCGTKRNVRATALALAAARGAHTAGVEPDDVDRVHDVCAAARIGLHYSDWEFKREAETRFRGRDWDILVATTTVAAGVNLPARAVIVRDTQVGLGELEVATVLQMFGRAGRIGAGEREGWAYLITTELERPNWQGALVEGYTVYSQIHASLPDHVLAEVLQGRITTLGEAEQWWLRTLCHHQGDEDTEPVVTAAEFLVEHGYLTHTLRPDATQALQVTDLGRLTARLMVPTHTGARLRTALASYTVPADADTAEDALAWLVGALVPELAFAPVAEPQRPIVATILKAGGRRDRMRPATAVGGLGAATSCAPGDLARAALLLVARSPELFARTGRMIVGLPATTLFPVLDQAPRYLAWLAAQGYLGTIHPWAAIVAADLSRRVRWRRCAPGRGAGRLLWMCEQMSTPVHAGELVPQLWKAAAAHGITAPDWPHATPPRGCRLEPNDYTALLRERATTSQLSSTGNQIVVTNALAGNLVTWTGRSTTSCAVTGDHTAAYPSRVDDDAQTLDQGAAVFTKRGDYKAFGWLTDYHQAQLPAD